MVPGTAASPDKMLLGRIFAYADAARYGDPAGWHTNGDMVRSAYTLRAADDD